MAATGKVKPVHYVSTTSVFDSPVYGNNGTTLYEDDTLQSYPESGGYGQSKWVAERVTFLARERGLPISIYRPGNYSH
jgi:thioester reductase-like protein